MTTIEIKSATEAQQKLCDAINLLDAVSRYSINQHVSYNKLFNTDVLKRLQGSFTRTFLDQLREPRPEQPPFLLLQQSNNFNEAEVKTLSPYCYKIQESADFNDVLGGLEANSTIMNGPATNGELLDSIIRSGQSKTVRSAVAGVLDAIGSLAFWHIREKEARALATNQEHTLVTQEDKSKAASEMWEQLRTYNSDADRRKLDGPISTRNTME